MKIKSITTEVKYIVLKTPFVTALRRVETIEFVRVSVVCDDGSQGLGEAPSTLAITGEDIAIIDNSIKKVKENLIGLEVKEALILLHKQSIGSSAKAALDMAFMSLLGFFRLENRESIKTDITISLNSVDEMLKDANQAWTLEESLKYVSTVEGIKIELIEQPVIAEDLDSLKIISQTSKIPIVADEATFTLEDVKKVLETQSADMINIKLMKCGGVSKAIEILEYARAKNIKCMLGSMLEGPYSINVALYLAFNYRDVVKYVDLDSPLMS